MFTACNLGGYGFSPPYCGKARHCSFLQEKLPWEMYTNATKRLHHPQSQAPSLPKLTIDSLHASWSKDGPSFPNEEFIQMMEWAIARSHRKMCYVMCRPILLTAKAEKPLRSPSTNKNTDEHFWNRRQHSVFSCRRSLFSLSPVSSFFRYMA